MSMEITVVKTQDGRLAPVSDIDAQKISKLKVGNAIKVTATKLSARSLKHHQLFFAGLLPLAMDYWEPKGGLIHPREKRILNSYTDYLETRIGKPGVIHHAMDEYLEALEDHRAMKYTANNKSVDDLLEWLKVEVGHYDLFHTPAGMMRRTKSINFNAMDEESFTEFYKKCFDVIWRTLLMHNFDNEDQAEEAVNYLLSMG